MITSAILNLFYSIMTWLSYPIRALGDASLPSGISSAISTASSALATVSMVLPISTMLLVLTFVLLVENYHFIYKVVMWVIQKIPGIT